MLQQLRRYIRRQEFYPGFLGVFINPFFIARRGLMVNVKKISHNISGRIIDVGCGSKPYKELFRFSEYIGVDIENPGHDHAQEDIDVFYDGKVLPFPAAAFDSVITNQVFEHVFNPEEFLKELNRVLKVGGNMLLTVPFVWDEHEQPYDYARYSSFGLKHVLEKNGFEVVTLIKSVNDFRVIAQLTILFIFKKTVTKNAWFNRFVTLVLITPITVLGVIISKILPSNTDLYLDNIVLARKIR